MTRVYTSDCSSRPAASESFPFPVSDEVDTQNPPIVSYHRRLNGLGSLLLFALFWVTLYCIRLTMFWQLSDRFLLLLRCKLRCHGVELVCASARCWR